MLTFGVADPMGQSCSTIAKTCTPLPTQYHILCLSARPPATVTNCCLLDANPLKSCANTRTGSNFHYVSTMDSVTGFAFVERVGLLHQSLIFGTPALYMQQNAYERLRRAPLSLMVLESCASSYWDANKLATRVEVVRSSD